MVYKFVFLIILLIIIGWYGRIYSMSKTKTMRQWIDEFSENIASESLKLLTTYKERHGEKVTDFVIGAFIGSFIELVVSRTLAAHKSNPNQKEAYEKTKAGLADTKLRIQEAVSKGFANAMGKHSGMNIEYYCLVKPVPEAANTKPC